MWEAGSLSHTQHNSSPGTDLKNTGTMEDDGVVCFLWICILVVRKLIIVAASHLYTHNRTHAHTRWHKHANAWQFPGELTTLDWWCRQSSICFVISLSLLSLFHSFIVTALVRPVWINHQSLCSSSVPPPLPFTCPASPTRPAPFRYIRGNLYSTWIHLAQWGLNKCVCQTQMAWSQCCRGTEGGMTGLSWEEGGEERRRPL